MTTPSEATGPGRLVHQLELATAIRHRMTNRANVPDYLIAEIIADALRAESIGAFVQRQAALTVALAGVAEKLVAAVLQNEETLAAALARVKAGEPMNPADVGLSADQVLEAVGRSVNLGR